MCLHIYTEKHIYGRMNTTTFFKALSDETRLRLVVLLERHGTLCVCELSGAVGQAQPKVSRHLAELRRTGLVEHHKQGLWVFYRLNPHLPRWAHDVLRVTAEAAAEQAPHAADLADLTLVADGCRRDRPATD